MKPQRLSRAGLLLAPSIRSRAYVQTLAAEGLTPDFCVLLPGDEMTWGGPELVENPCGGALTHFAPGRPARDSVQDLNWDHIELPTSDINDPVNIPSFENLDVDVLVYSGMNKALVDEATLSAAPRFLHVHGGYLPGYRAATASYFGLLETGHLGVSALWLDKGVDTGDIVARAWYPNVPGFDMDHVIEPLSRAHLLVQVLRHYAERGVYPSIDAQGESSESFFVIHPVLKHLALRHFADIPE